MSKFYGKINLCFKKNLKAICLKMKKERGLYKLIWKQKEFHVSFWNKLLEHSSN